MKPNIYPSSEPHFKMRRVEKIKEKKFSTSLRFARTIMTAILLLASCFLLLSANAADNPYAAGDQLFNSGKYEEAANWYLSFTKEHAGDSKLMPEAYIKLGESLEKMSDIINTRAERVCFRSGGKLRGTPCMQDYAAKLNATYGPGSFEYSEALVIIQYTGVHYNKVADEFPKSDLAAKSAYLRLSKNLVGHPEQVLPRIKAFTDKYKSGEWGRKGRLLWARMNEDIWWIHRKWSWVLYNWSISPEELIVKAEPYRQEALRSFEDLIKKDGGTPEGKMAKKEHELLKVYKDDGRLYGIVNESDITGTKAIPGIK